MTVEATTEEAVVVATDRRAPRISQADVFRTADELLVQGDRPTIDRVRMRLGRGSPNTINDHLDVWWARLGARLRDLPGREFPQVPEPVSHALLHLWNQALESSHAAVREAAVQRECSLVEREAALEAASQALAERETAAGVRMAALEEALSLAREQLLAANQRAQALERSVVERDAESTRLRARIEGLEAEGTQYRGQLENAAAIHQAERTQLLDRYTNAENHWLRELDRTRESAKELAKTHERQGKERRAEVVSLTRERDELRQQLVGARAEVKATTDLCGQLEQLFQRRKPESKAHPRSAPSLPVSKSKRRRA